MLTFRQSLGYSRVCILYGHSKARSRSLFIFRHSIIDVHSHLAVVGSPELQGNSDGNSLHGPILPWLRSLDGLNTHDDGTGPLTFCLPDAHFAHVKLGFAHSVAGGLTTALILPGSANAIGEFGMGTIGRAPYQSNLLRRPGFRDQVETYVGAITDSHAPRASVQP